MSNLISKLTELINDYKSESLLSVGKDGNTRFLKLSSETVRGLRKSKEAIVAKCKAEDIEDVNIDSVIPDVNSKFKGLPLKIKGMSLVVKNDDFEQLIVYVTGQNSRRIQRKWSNNLSSYTGVPIVNLVWAGGDNNVMG